MGSLGGRVRRPNGPAKEGGKKAFGPKAEKR
jgi:hypothetical protein